jgi:hypothetical protein
MAAMILGGASAGAGQLRSHVIAGVRVEPFFQRTRGQAQGLVPRRHFYRFQIQVGDRLAS